MTGTKRHSAMLLLGVVVLWSGALAAQNEQTSFSGGIGVLNPCNGAVVIVNGMNYIDVHQNSTGQEGTHVAIHMRFEGTGQDNASNPFNTMFLADGQFTSDAPSYDVPYHSTWVGNGAPNFAMNGILRVWVKAGVATRSGIVAADPVCKSSPASDNAKK